MNEESFSTAAPVAPRGTTIERTLLAGPAGEGGFRPIIPGPGEPHIVRTELAARPSAPSTPAATRPLIAFAQLTDVHLVDHQSPARVEFLDRYNDPGSRFAGLANVTGSYRANEMLSVHVADSMVRRINEIGIGPVYGMPIAFAVSTGDNADNSQYNEFRWFIDVLDGGPLRPDSGKLGTYEGVMDWERYDAHYWHPEGTPDGQIEDRPRALHGFPIISGLLEKALAQFTAEGLRMPWYSA